MGEGGQGVELPLLDGRAEQAPAAPGGAGVEALYWPVIEHQATEQDPVAGAPQWWASLGGEGARDLRSLGFWPCLRGRVWFAAGLPVGAALFLAAAVVCVPPVAFARQLALQRKDDLSACLRVQDDVDFQTRMGLVPIDHIRSAEGCRAKCRFHAACGAWTWGRDPGMLGVTHVCFLKRLAESEQPVALKKAGVVSGLACRTGTSTGSMASNSPKACGFEDGIDYVTDRNIKRQSHVTSAEICRAVCRAAPGCDAWTWGNEHNVPGLANMCWLKAIHQDSDWRKSPKKNVVSGLACVPRTSTRTVSTTTLTTKVSQTTTTITTGSKTATALSSSSTVTSNTATTTSTSLTATTNLAASSTSSTTTTLPQRMSTSTSTGADTHEGTSTGTSLDGELNLTVTVTTALSRSTALATSSVTETSTRTTTSSTSVTTSTASSTSTTTVTAPSSSSSTSSSTTTFSTSSTTLTQTTTSTTQTNSTALTTTHIRTSSSSSTSSTLVAATNISTTAGVAAAEPSSSSSTLFCFLLLRPSVEEVALVLLQYHRHSGLFDCDQQTVFSNETLARDLKERDVGFQVSLIHRSLECDRGGELQTPLNVELYQAVWDAVLSEGFFRLHAWTVKVEPETVFLPDRLRPVLRRYNLVDAREKTGMYINNCRFGLHGPIEVFSRAAVEALGAGWQHCRHYFHMACSGPCWWSEDLFVDQCLSQVFYVKRVSIHHLLAEEHCNPPKDWRSCEDRTRVAYHPFNEKPDFVKCLETAEARGRGAGVRRHIA